MQFDDQLLIKTIAKGDPYKEDIIYGTPLISATEPIITWKGLIWKDISNENEEVGYDKTVLIALIQVERKSRKGEANDHHRSAKPCADLSAAGKPHLRGRTAGGYGDLGGFETRGSLPLPAGDLPESGRDGRCERNLAPGEALLRWKNGGLSPSGGDHPQRGVCAGECRAFHRISGGTSRHSHSETGCPFRHSYSSTNSFNADTCDQPE